MKKLKVITIIISLILCCILYIKCSYNENDDFIVIQGNSNIYFKKQIDKNDPPCLQMYHFITKHAKKYNIPLDYAFGLAYQETRYQGIFHWKYNHKQISSTNALGPMQIIPSTADGIWKRKVDRDSLKNNIELNVETSMKFLRLLKDRYKEWPKVFGYYNTGQILVNQYALNIINKNYKWIN